MLRDPWRGPKAPSASVLGCPGRICLPRNAYLLASGHPSPDGLVTAVSPLRVERVGPGTGIFTRFPSPTPLGLGLGADLPGADDPGSGTLRLSVTRILTSFLAYSFRDSLFLALHQTSQSGFAAQGMLPYRETLPKRCSTRSFGSRLSPDHYRRKST